MHGRHLFKWDHRWNILGFTFTKRDAQSSVYKISMRMCYYDVRTIAQTSRTISLLLKKEIVTEIKERNTMQGKSR
jgi:hypothetical protein